jgi:hypothetical protein
MQSKGTSLFAQMLQYFNRTEFTKVVRKHGGDNANKGFTTWDQCVSMLFCQLAKAQSLREICGGLKSCVGKLSHLGVHRSPTRSNLSYANSHRSWEIEIFFKTIKQHLKIKTFVGTSPNAVKIQLWTALIAILLLKYMKMLSSYAHWSLSNLIALLRFNLFTYRDLNEWLNDPYDSQIIVPGDTQLCLPGLGQQQGAIS